MSIDTDVAIVGGGPAGLSAATWLARHRRSAVVVDSSEYRNRWVDSSHGYLGNDPTSPDELRAAAHRDLARYDSVRVVADRVTTVTADGDAFTVQLQQAGRMTFSRLILATGVADQFPSVSRFFDHYGRSVFHCPSCDGYETRGEPVVVIGWSPDIAGFAAGLLEWASSVTVVTDGRRFEGDSRHRRHLGDLGVAVLTDEVVELCGERGALQAVRLRDGGLLDCSFAFFSIAHRPRNQLALDLGCEVVDEGCIVVDDEGRTSVPGVYAAGDVTPGLQYVQVAAADGARAGTACALSLRDEALG
ncbi:MAG: NAD(P)/FAD-dependent oxidoreductase [Actinomycetota bacterium]|jgi:thioredoxin reductase|nr:NAD(P)/FAD-dependent oxidoreductase [Euzebyaceae bacterium]MDQ3451385.1 NAD(P)/FAD-dependent oxidoreductase [Actinomycetota bacterium]